MTDQHSRTVLVVEDDTQIRILMAAILKRGGYQVLMADNGGAAQALCRDHDGPIDLLLTDMMMPDMNGREVADRLRSQRPALKVLIVSAYGGSPSVMNEMETSGIPFLAKPVTPSVLLNKVQEVLGRA